MRGPKYYRARSVSSGSHERHSSDEEDYGENNGYSSNSYSDSAYGEDEGEDRGEDHADHGEDDKKSWQTLDDEGKSDQGDDAKSDAKMKLRKKIHLQKS